MPHPAESPEFDAAPRRPWQRLLGAPGIAFDARKVILAALGLALTWLGWRGLDLAFGPAGYQEPLTRTVSLESWSEGIEAVGHSSAALVAEPFRLLAGPFGDVLSVGEGATAWLHAALAALWGVAVWGLIGGAIARMAVVQAATGDHVGIGAACRFAARRAGWLIGTPLCPLIGLALLALPCAALGLAYRVEQPIVHSAAGVLAFLPLLAGLVMALILAGLALGWPLMILTIAAEDEDGLDALSRSYSYLQQRPTRYLSYVALAWLVGAIGLVGVRLLAGWTIHLARWALAFGGPDAALLDYFRVDSNPADTPGLIHDSWMGTVDLLARGWIYAYAFSAAAVIYLLIRHNVDGTALDEVAGLPPFPQQMPTTIAADPVNAGPQADGGPGAGVSAPA